jgi:hypothetical protein
MTAKLKKRSGWVDECVEVKSVLCIAYNNQIFFIENDITQGVS